MTVQETVLDNGLRIVTEAVPSVRSVAVGFWVNTGSRDERPKEAGCAHFLEHLLFKGSKNISAREIAESFDSLGASNNAFTGKERTCFWAHLPDESLLQSCDIFVEMLRRPAFRQNEIDTESKVVIEEIKLNDDDTSDVAHEAFISAAYGGHPLALPILGTEKSISGMQRDTIKSFWQRRYNASSVVVVAAGNVNHDAFCEKIAEHFGGWRVGAQTRKTFGHTLTKRANVVEKDTEQVNLVLGGKSFSVKDDRRYALAIANKILGDGMASRLFTTIREERGLVYSIHMGNIPHVETGMWYIYAGTTPAQTEEVLSLINVELGRIRDEAVPKEEIDRIKRSARASVLLGQESTPTRMRYLGGAILNGIDHTSVDERIALIDAVTEADVQAVANEILVLPFVVGAVGPISEKDILAMM